MTNKHTAKTQITIGASADKVWKALTTPVLIKQYMMGADVETDWEIGSPLVYRGTYQGKAYEEKGVIQQIQPKKLLQATHFSASSGKLVRRVMKLKVMLRTRDLTTALRSPTSTSGQASPLSRQPPTAAEPCISQGTVG